MIVVGDGVMLVWLVGVSVGVLIGIGIGIILRSIGGPQ